MTWMSWRPSEICPYGRLLASPATGVQVRASVEVQPSVPLGRPCVTSRARSDRAWTVNVALATFDAPGSEARVHEVPSGETHVAPWMWAGPPQPPSPRTAPERTKPPSKLATLSRTSVPLETVGSGRVRHAAPSGEVQICWVSPSAFVPRAMNPAGPPSTAVTEPERKSFGSATRVQDEPSGEDQSAVRRS